MTYLCRFVIKVHSLTHSLTQPLNHSTTRFITHSFTALLTHSFLYELIHSLIQSLTHFLRLALCRVYVEAYDFMRWPLLCQKNEEGVGSLFAR